MILSASAKSQDVDTIIAFTIEKSVIDLSTGATYNDSLYIVAVYNSVEFPFFGKKRNTSLSYNVYASKSTAWSGYQPIYFALPLNFNTGYFLNGFSVSLILTKIRNDMLTKFSGFTTGDIVTDIR